MDPDLQRRQESIRNIDLDSGHPFVKVNHPASGDIVNSPVHVAGYGTAFEGTIVVRVLDDSGKELGEAVMDSEGGNGIIGEFYGEVEFSYSPSYQLGVVEAFEPSPKDETPLNMVKVPIIFDASIIQQQS